MEGLVWMRTRQPMGPRGVASKLKGLPCGREGGYAGLAEEVE